MLSDSLFKCNTCGQEFPAYLNTCPNCGAVPLSERHPFISFWLWFCLVANFLSAIFMLVLLLASPLSFSETWSDQITFLGSVVAVVGSAMLLKKKKAGFYLFVLVTVVNVIALILSSGISLFLFMEPARLVLLYFILQITRGGVAYWKRLE